VTLICFFFLWVVSIAEAATAGKAAELGVECAEAMWRGLLPEATTPGGCH